MILSDYVIDFFAQKGVREIFTIPGGGCIFLNDAIERNKDITPVLNHHEQACALSAEGYARLRNDIGVYLVTSGPGGSNAWTGTLCSYQDSVPVFVISGNVNKELTTDYTGLNLRQLGDQEFNVIKTVKNFTKYAHQINDPLTVRYHLERAYFEATSGRPGPVWLDIPLNIQNYDIDVNKLSGFTPTVQEFEIKDINIILDKLKNSKRPLIIAGHGVRLSHSVDLLDSILETYKIPVITSFNGNDSVSNEYEYFCGRFGTHANISANKLVQEADFLLTLGSRLYVRQIGYNFKDFAKNAFKVYVDVDEGELHKPTVFPDIRVVADVNKFLSTIQNSMEVGDIHEWRTHCKKTMNESPTVLDRHRTSVPLSVYHFMDKLNAYMKSDVPVVTSDGSANIVGMQVLRLKKHQRLFSNKSTAPMGYGLPAAIGACFANNKASVICLEGDGSVHMNIHELQVMKQNNLPIKLFVINNDGYLSIKITQKTFCKGLLSLSDSSSGLSLPSYERIAYAYDIPYVSIKTADDLIKLDSIMSTDKPIFVEVFVNEYELHEPKVMASIDETGKIVPGTLENIKWLD